MDEDRAYEQLGRQLVADVPELTAQVDHLLRSWSAEVPGPHVVFGDVLNPYLLGLLASENEVDRQAPTLRRIFAFLERLARDDDPRVREVVAVTVCERLGDDPRVLEIARSYMGEAMKILSRRVEAEWGGGEATETTLPPAVAAHS